MLKLTVVTLRALVIGMVSVCGLHAAVPKSAYYPFPGADLRRVRAISEAERIGDSSELFLAWKMYGELQNSWAPGAPKPSAQTISNLDNLKAKLEALPKPLWFQEALNASGPPSASTLFPAKVGDAIFLDQADSAAFQAQKALAIVYLTEHEIDRPSGANNAGLYLTLLSLKHPWDWEVHALFARLLGDAGIHDAAFHEAVLSIYLNPSPSDSDLQYFAFIAAGKKDQWSAVQDIIRDVAKDHRAAHVAIERASPLFESTVASESVPPKTLH